MCVAMGNAPPARRAPGVVQYRALSVRHQKIESLCTDLSSSDRIVQQRSPCITPSFFPDAAFTPPPSSSPNTGGRLEDGNVGGHRDRGATVRHRAVGRSRTARVAGIH